jgi:hypothetical protein
VGRRAEADGAQERGLRQRDLPGVLSTLLYLTNKRIWAGIKGKKHA